MARERILLIEDDADLAKSLDLALGREGYVIDHSLSGLEGLSRVVESPPELLLLDLNLPDMDGLSICRATKSLFSSFQSAHVPESFFVPVFPGWDKRLPVLQES